MTEPLIVTTSTEIDAVVLNQLDDLRFVAPDVPNLDDVVEELESAVIGRIQEEMGRWSELHQPNGVEAGRQSHITYFCGGDWKVYVDEDRYFDYGNTEYDFTVCVAKADVPSIKATATPVIAHLKQSADEMLALLNEVGEETHEIDDLSLEATIALTLRVLDASPLVEYGDGTCDVTPMPSGGVSLGIRSRIETSERLESELLAGRRLREARG